MTRRVVVAALAVLGLIITLAACSRSRTGADPTWVPQQSIPPVPLPTPVPEGGGSGDDTGPTPSGGSGGSGGSSSAGQKDPAVVATRLAAPTGLALLPDGSALVGERTTGRILQVQPVPGKPVRLVRTLTGLDLRGGGGLLDLALSPSYAEDGLIIALVTTRSDTRVVHFTARGPVTPIVTGIPHGRMDNAGRLFLLPDESILVGTGDAGTATNAARERSKAGKVLRIDELGRPAPGDPTAGSAVYTSGHHTVNGLCYDQVHRSILETEDGDTGELNKIIVGHSYGWPTGDGDGPVAEIPNAPGVGSCAVIKDTVYVASLSGKALLSARIDGTGTVGPFSPSLAGKYGRLLTVVAATDGSLWITTSNRDGHGRPVRDDERVLHITPSGGGGGSQPE
jgi:glucose/arabinose dehydrogenase